MVGPGAAVSYGRCVLTDDHAEAVTRRFPDGEAWLAGLEARVADVLARWRLTPVRPLPGGIGGYLLDVRTADERDAVLKLSPTAGEQGAANRLEAYALRRWAGNGAARMLDVDLGAGALLLERCRPGTALDALDDAEMLERGCALARRLQRPADEEDRLILPHAAEEVAIRAQRFGGLMDTLGHPFSAAREREIEALHRALATGADDLVACHGDLNPGNVLAHGSGHVAIDPLPVLADAAYDAVSLVWSRRSWLLEQPDRAQVLEHRIAIACAALDVDAERVRAWTLVRLTGLLEERAEWGGYDAAPFVALAELL